MTVATVTDTTARRRDVLLTAATVAYLAGATLLAVSPLRPAERISLVQTFALFACGVLIVRRTDTPVIGWLLVVPGVTFNLLYADLPAWSEGAGGGSFLFPLWYLGVVALGLLLLMFPAGRLPSTAARVAAAVLVAAHVIQLAIDYGGLLGLTGEDIDAVGDYGDLVSFAGFLTAVVVGLVDQARRYRRRPRVEQLQLKWFLVAIVGQLAYPATVFVGIGQDSMAFLVVDNIATTLWPVTILLAITRYRLYEIDRLISRTLGYALVLGLLAVLFVGGVAGVTSLVPTQDGLAVALTTVVVVALFDPLRRRVVEVVDRRFDRTRYVARQVVEGFGRDVQDETDLDDIRDRVHDVVGKTMAPRTVAVWLPRSGATR